MKMELLEAILLWAGRVRVVFKARIEKILYLIWVFNNKAIKLLKIIMLFFMISHMVHALAVEVKLRLKGMLKDNAKLISIRIKVFLIAVFRVWSMELLLWMIIFSGEKSFQNFFRYNYKYFWKNEKKKNLIYLFFFV